MSRVANEEVAKRPASIPVLTPANNRIMIGSFAEFGR
jgi:hypothetical protein